jgi:hypothetical protein
LSKAQALTIDELTALYAQSNDKMKEAKANVEHYRTMLTDYAQAHRHAFNGKLLTLPNGIKIESRAQLKAEFAREKITLEWLENLIEEGFGELIEITFADKEVLAIQSIGLDQLMKEIGYKTTVKEILAIKAA